MASTPTNGALITYHGLKVNDAVYVDERESRHEQLEGVVAFLGNVMFAGGDDWVGVRLTGASVGLGKNDGAVEGARYFTCGPKNGIFVRRAHVKKRSLSRLEQLRHKRDLLDEDSRGIRSSPERQVTSAFPPNLVQNTSEFHGDLLDEVLETEYFDTSEHDEDLEQEASTTLTHQSIEPPVPVPRQSPLVDTADKAREAPTVNETCIRPSTQDPLTTPLLAKESEPPSTLRRRMVQLHSENLEDDVTDIPESRRILDRDGAFHQSRGKWSVQRLLQGSSLRRASTTRRRCWRLCDDWFHSLAYKPTVLLMSILFLSYTSAVFFFAFVYRLVNYLGSKYTVNQDGTIKENPFCGMDITNHMEALYFSLSTMTTIGYGVSDYYFGDCWTPLVLVLWQVCTAITFDAVAIGLLFLRISRGRKRGKTIVFSDKAVIRRVRECPYLFFRIGELRRNFIIEAAVRVYCVRHERYPVQAGNQVSQIETTHFVTRNVSLLHPDETTGSHILMSLPQVIVHKMNLASPLIPPRPAWYDKDGDRHLAPSLESEAQSLSDTQRIDSYAAEKDDIRKFHTDRNIEVIVLVEGTDEVTGSALQARHSYFWDDIMWDYTFAPCVFPCGPEDDHEDDSAWFFQNPDCRRRVIRPACCIDFDKFHEIQEAPVDCDACPFVPQES